MFVIMKDVLPNIIIVNTSTPSPVDLPSSIHLFKEALSLCSIFECHSIIGPPDSSAGERQLNTTARFTLPLHDAA